MSVESNNITRSLLVGYLHTNDTVAAVGEELIADLLQKTRSCTITNPTDHTHANDNGIDFYADNSNTRTGVQIKGGKSTIRSKEIRELGYHAKDSVDNVLFVTFARFTGPAISVAENDPDITLWNLSNIAQKLVSIGHGQARKLLNKHLKVSIPAVPPEPINNSINTPVSTESSTTPTEPTTTQTSSAKTTPTETTPHLIDIEQYDTRFATKLTDLTNRLRDTITELNELPSDAALRTRSISRSQLRNFFGNPTNAIEQAGYSTEESNRASVSKREQMVFQLSALRKCLPGDITTDDIVTHCKFSIEELTAEFESIENMYRAAGKNTECSAYFNKEYPNEVLLAELRRLGWALGTQPEQAQSEAYGIACHSTYCSRFGKFSDAVGLAFKPEMDGEARTARLVKYTKALREFAQKRGGRVTRDDVDDDQYGAEFSSETCRRNFDGWNVALQWADIPVNVPDASSAVQSSMVAGD